MGRLAALNRTRHGVVLLVDTGDEYRAVPAAEVAAVELVGEPVRLTPAGEETFAAAPPATPHTGGADGPSLVRYVPTELSRLATATGKRRSRSRLWLLAGGLVLLAGFAILPANLLIEQEAGGPLKWAWLAGPVVLLGVAAWVASAAIDREAGRPVPLREKLADAPALLLGISPRTAKRG